MKLELMILGTPAPGGSKSAFALRRRDGSLVLRPGGAPVINITDAGGQANKEWRRCVAIQAKSAWRKPLLTVALAVTMEFVLERPKSHYGTGRNAGTIKLDAPARPTMPPDVLKLARSTEDALTGVLWEDDSLNVRLTLDKRYAKIGEQTGCRLTVETLEEPEESLPFLDPVRLPRSEGRPKAVTT